MLSLRDLIREVHRRSVWQVLGVYLVASWGALQVVDTLVGVAGLPDWLPLMAVAMLIAGLPIVLATAIVQEGTPAAGPATAEGALDETGAGAGAGGDPGGTTGGPSTGQRPGIHRQIFTWRNALMGGILAFAVWGVVAAGWLLFVGPSARVLDGGGDVGPGVPSEETPSAPGFFTVVTERPGSEVEALPVTATGELRSGATVHVGTTPVPATSFDPGEYLIRITPAGGEPTLRRVVVTPADTTHLTTMSPPDGQAVPGMVFVPSGLVRAEGAERSVEAFLLDRYEVTNAEFLEFVANGGYADMSLWPVTMTVRGVEVAREEAVGRFVDRTGESGPRSWSGGVFPQGEGDHPVVGVSWYEARAYARWVGKRLPTRDEWWRGAVGDGLRFPWGDDTGSVDARANFDLQGTTPVGSFPTGVSPFGAFDMAGNVREWVADRLPDAPDRRLAIGGSWQDPSYSFDPVFADAFPADFTSSSVGFRCARSLSEEL
jgi:formylglycine-generating enzyme required for sulfatase activity